MRFVSGALSARSAILILAPMAAGQVGPLAEPLVLTGRCVDGVTGEPVGGCRVSVTGTTFQGRPLEGVHAERRSLGTESGPDGRFRLKTALPDESISDGDRRPEVHVDVTHPERWPASGSFPLESFGPGEHWEIRDVRMLRGVPLTLRVRERDGAAAAGVELWLRRRPEADDSDPDEAVAPRPWIHAHADHEGRLLIPALRSGRWTIQVLDREVTKPPGELAIPFAPGGAGEADVEVRLVVAERTISGRVLDQDGRPWPGLRVQASWPGFLGGMRLDRTRPVLTGPDGAFRIASTELGGSLPEDRVAIEVSPDQGILPVDLGEHPGGARDLDLLLLRGGTLRLDVVSAVTGEPIEEFIVLPAHRASDLVSRATPGRRHPGGLVDLTGLAPGPRALDVFPLARGFLARLAVSVVVPESGTAIIRVPVERVHGKTVRLVFPERTPAAGSVVELVVPYAGDTPGFEWVDTVAGRGLRRGPIVESILADSGTTGADGCVRLHAAPRPWPVWIRARGPGHVPILRVLPAWLPEGEDIRIEVAAGARVRGKAGPAPALALLDFSGPEIPEPVGIRNLIPAVERSLRPDVRWWQRPHLEVAIEPDAGAPADSLTADDVARLFPDRIPLAVDGSFDLEDLPRSRVKLRLVAGVADAGRVLLEWTTVDVRSGETRDVRLDVEAEAWIGRAVRGSVLRDGKRWPRATVELYAFPQPPYRGGAPQEPEYILRTDEDASLSPKVLRPGSYRAVAVGPGTDGITSERIPCDGNLDVKAGGGVFVVSASSSRVRFGWKDGRRTGPWTHWHRNGGKASEGVYAAGRREGRWRFWREDGEADPELTGVYAGGARTGS